jgi:hypothetical protein
MNSNMLVLSENEYARAPLSHDCWLPCFGFVGGVATCRAFQGGSLLKLRSFLIAESSFLFLLPSANTNPVRFP